MAPKPKPVTSSVAQMKKTQSILKMEKKLALLVELKDNTMLSLWAILGNLKGHFDS